jgi:arylsulfatase A-like enzyme
MGLDPQLACLMAMCENIDDNVGRVLAALEELKIRKDTIVIFFSDNGPNTFRYNDGLKGKKGSVDEGGMRVPCFVSWPGQNFREARCGRGDGPYRSTANSHGLDWS